MSATPLNGSGGFVCSIARLLEHPLMQQPLPANRNRSMTNCQF